MRTTITCLSMLLLGSVILGCPKDTRVPVTDRAPPDLTFLIINGREFVAIEPGGPAEEITVDPTESVWLIAFASDAGGVQKIDLGVGELFDTLGGPVEGFLITLDCKEQGTAIGQQVELKMSAKTFGDTVGGTPGQTVPDTRYAVWEIPPTSYASCPETTMSIDWVTGNPKARASDYSGNATTSETIRFKFP